MCKAVKAVPASANVTASVELASAAERATTAHNYNSMKPENWGLVQVERLSMGAIRCHEMARPSASVDVRACNMVTK